MRSLQHIAHINNRTSHNDCNECRADTERQFVSTGKWTYGHVSEYLSYIRPRLLAIQNGEISVNSRVWLTRFRKALDSRISLKVPPAIATRKGNDGYRDRLRNALSGRNASARYLRTMAARGASTLSR